MSTRSSFQPALCEVCGKPGNNVGYAGILCEKHNVKFKDMKRPVGVKDKYLTTQSGNDVVSYASTPKAEKKSTARHMPYPAGYIPLRSFCRKHGKSRSYDAYRKLYEAGEATSFCGELIVKESANWPYRFKRKRAVP